MAKHGSLSAWEWSKRVAALWEIGCMIATIASWFANLPVLAACCLFLLGMGALSFVGAWISFRLWPPKTAPISPIAAAPAEEFRKVMGPWFCHRDFGRPQWDRLQDELREIPEWASISELSCQLFGHATFTLETYERLVNWLKHSIGSSDDEPLLALPRSEVVRRLRDAANKKR